MKVWLGSHALDVMREEATARQPLESGGVLLGWRAVKESVVIKLLGPGPQALHGRYRFMPDHAWQLSEIKRIFYKTRGDLDYLGDWHSHPNGESAMSNEDHTTLRRIAKRVPEPLMMIFGRNANDKNWNLNCWKGSLSPGFIFRRFNAIEQTIKLFEPPPSWSALSASGNFSGDEIK